MSHMAPEPIGELDEQQRSQLAELQIDFEYADGVLKTLVELGNACVQVRLDWRDEEHPPGPDLEVLLSALPEALIRVHQHINEEPFHA